MYLKHDTLEINVVRTLGIKIIKISKKKDSIKKLISKCLVKDFAGIDTLQYVNENLVDVAMQNFALTKNNI